MKIKKVGLLSLSAALSLSVFTNTAAANVHNDTEQKQVITIANVDSEMTKEELIKQFKKLFPNKFDFLTSKDFHFNTGHRYPEDDEAIIRYSLSFNKEMNGKHLHGSVEFVGKELTIQSFYYRPFEVKDAVFPAKVDQKEALEIATSFIEGQYPNENYQLSDNQYMYYPMPRSLTEPIQYRFNFERLENGVPVSGQNMNITIMGNGEMVELYSGQYYREKANYENKANIISNDAAIEKIKSKLGVSLQYMIDFDYRNEEAKVKLIYGVEPPIFGMNAKNGKWLVGQEFVDALPGMNPIKMLSSSALAGTTKPISQKEAKAIAENLLKPGDENTKLRIEEIYEHENKMLGKTVYSVHYQYQSKNSGYGSSIEIDKNTGEVISFHDITRDMYAETAKEEEKKEEDTKKGVSFEKALEAAVEAVRKYTPSIMHEYSYPIYSEKQESYEGRYHFSFPRVKNGIIVQGDSINIGIDKEGAISHYNVHSPIIKEWPNVEKVVSKDKALKAYLEELNVKLAYSKVRYDSKDYVLMYHTEFKNAFNYFNAVTGEWERPSHYPNQPEQPEFEVDHPTAEKELNYLIQMGIIKVDDPSTFDPDQPVTRGEALEILMKSIVNYYEFDRIDEKKDGTFVNINKEHDLYNVVELAAQQNIIDTSKKSFPVEFNITKQELAYWYIRTLGLDQAAKHYDIYKISFNDANKIQKEYTGYIALADKLGLLEANKSNMYHATSNVTLAEVAVSVTKLAQKMSEKRPGYYY